MSENFGKIAQVIGPVVDVIFEGDANMLPPIYTALKVDRASTSCITDIHACARKTTLHVGK